MRVALIAALVLVLTPIRASAVTVQEIVALSKAGVSEQVILALIERDQSIFAIDANRLVALKNDGVSEAIVLAMLRSGRPEPTSGTTPSDPARAIPSAAPAAAVVEPGPIVGVVGHGPDIPNTAHAYDPAAVAPYAVPYILPYSAPFLIHHSAHFVRSRPIVIDPVQLPPAVGTPSGHPFVPAQGIFFNNPASGMFFTNRPAVTVCSGTDGSCSR